MMRINQQKNAAAARSYFTSRAEYYLGGSQELPGTWGGKGAERLGLAGEVAKADFDAVCGNRKPDGSKLTARDRAGRVVGYDFNFHVPKSVSMALLLHGDSDILTAFRSALAATLGEMERAMQTRIRKGGAMDDRTTGEILYSQHIHLTARPVDGVPDPHLHAHAFVFNATFDGVEGRWKASKIADIYRDAPYYQAVFLSHLAHEVTELGFAVETTAKGWEIAGLASLVAKFSRRTAQIERLADARGITDPVVKNSLGAETRRHKRNDATIDQLRTLWLQRLDDGECSALAAAAAGAGLPAASSLDLAVIDAVRSSFAEGHGLVPETRLVASALVAQPGRFTADAVRRRLPSHGIVVRDYDTRRFCGRRDPRDGQARWERERRDQLRDLQLEDDHGIPWGRGPVLPPPAVHGR